MRKKFFYVMLLLAGMLLFTACLKFTSEEKEQALKDGKASFENYLNNNIPGTVILSADITLGKEYVESIPDLTDYLYGEYEEDGETYQYYYNITTQEMFSSKHFSELEEAVRDRVIKLSGFAEDVEIEALDVKVILPKEQAYLSKTAKKQVFLDRKEGVLPETVADVQEYLDRGTDREVIEVSIEVNVSDGENLADFPVPKFSSLLKQNGIHISNMVMRKNMGVLDADIDGTIQRVYVSKEVRTFIGGYSDSPGNAPYHTVYHLWDSVDKGDYTIWGEVLSETKRTDPTKEEVLEYDLSKDIDVHQPTSVDYEIRRGSDKLMPRFFLLAKDGSDLLKNDYRRKAPNQDKYWSCFWGELPDSDWWVLMDHGGVSFSYEIDLRSYGPRS